MDSQRIQLELAEYKDVIDLRREWSGLFKRVINTILFFEIAITVAVGFDVLHFQDEWFLRLIILGGFAQILVMPYLVTEFLFNKKSTVSSGNGNK